MDPLNTLYEQLNKHLPGLDLRRGEPMARHTTFRVGGPAALMALPRGEEELRAVLALAAQEGVRPFFLGKGSNLLVADEGVDAFLIKLAGGLTRLECRGETGLYVASGVTLAQAAAFAAEQGLTGLEFAHGIPGTLGGGVFMNAGAYDGELAQVIAWVDCLDLAPGDPQAIRAKMADLAQRRRAKQPLEYPSAGSTFKRPAGHFAGGLIEQCGLKGTAVGGAQVSEKHAGFVINTGGATCRDILTLIRLVRDTVRRETGVELEPEVRLLGCTLEEP